MEPGVPLCSAARNPVDCLQPGRRVHGVQPPVMIDWMFLLVTGVIAYHALTHRNEDGQNDIGHMLFGAIALLFFMRVLLVDVLGVW